MDHSPFRISVVSYGSQDSEHRCSIHEAPPLLKNEAKASGISQLRSAVAAAEFLENTHQLEVAASVHLSVPASPGKQQENDLGTRQFSKRGVVCPRVSSKEKTDDNGPDVSGASEHAVDIGHTLSGTSENAVDIGHIFSTASWAGEVQKQEPSARRSLSEWRPKVYKKNSTTASFKLAAHLQAAASEAMEHRSSLEERTHSSKLEAVEVKSCATQTDPFEAPMAKDDWCNGSTGGCKFDGFLFGVSVCTQTDTSTQRLVAEPLSEHMRPESAEVSENRSTSPFPRPFTPLTPSGWTTVRPSSPGLSWTPPFPPDPPGSGTSRPSTGRRARPATAGRSEVPTGAHSTVCRDLNQTRAELSDTAMELSHAKAKIAILDRREVGKLRRAQDLMLMREGPRSGGAIDDTQFRYIPACAARELVIAKKRIAPFELGDGASRKIHKLNARVQDAELLAHHERKRSMQLEDQLRETNFELDELTTEHNSLWQTATLVCQLIEFRKRGAARSLENRLWRNIGDRLEAHGFELDGHEEIELKEPSFSAKRLSMGHTLSSEKGEDGKRKSLVQRRRSIWKQEHFDALKKDTALLLNQRRHSRHSSDLEDESREVEEAEDTLVLTGKRRSSAKVTEAIKRERDRRKSIEMISAEANARRIEWFWSIARGFAKRLAAVKGREMLSSHRFVAALYNDFVERCDDFEALADGMGLHEFIAYRSREEEFHLRVNRMIGDIGISSTSAAETTPIETVMKQQYDEAFDLAGGQKLVEECAQIIGTKVRLLHQLRAKGRVTQDSGFDILGLDELYKMNEVRKEKFTFEVERIASKTSGYAIIPGLKDRVRARTKILTKYGNDTSCLTDLLRASITYSGIQEVYSAVNMIIDEDLGWKRTDFFIREYEDRFINARDGYRDIMMLFEVDGTIAECQLHCNCMIQAKKGGGHMMYRKQRQIREFVFEACMRNNEAEITTLVRGHKTSAPGVKDKGGRSSLHYACQHGSLVASRLLLQNSADPWIEDNHGMLPIELALKCCHFDTIALVLDRMYVTVPSGGKVMRRFVEHTVLWWTDHTAFAAPSDLIRYKEPWLLGGKSMVNVAMHHAQFGGQKMLEGWLISVVSNGQHRCNIDRAQVLLAAGFDMAKVAGRASVMDVAIEQGHKEMAGILRKFGEKDKDCCTCWIRSVHDHLRDAAVNVDNIKAIAALEARADPNRFDACANKRSPLMAFAGAGDLETCKVLIACQAQVTQIDNFRCAAVHYAAAAKQTEVQQYLESLKMVPNLGMKKGDSAAKYLLDAVVAGCIGAFAYAENENDFRDALVQTVPPFGNTLLHCAVEATREVDPAGQVAKVLLGLRADPAAMNSRDYTPIHAAAQAGHQELYTLMVTYIKLKDREADGEEKERSRRGSMNAFGDEGSFGPRELLERTLKRKQMKDDERRNMERGFELNSDQKEDNKLMLKVGFLAFQHTALHAQVKRQTEGESASFLDILKQRIGDSDEEGSFTSDSIQSAESLGGRSLGQRSGRSSKSRSSGKKGTRTLDKRDSRKTLVVKKGTKHEMGEATPRATPRCSTVEPVEDLDDSASSLGRSSFGAKSERSPQSLAPAPKKWKKVQVRKQVMAAMHHHDKEKKPSPRDGGESDKKSSVRTSEDEKVKEKENRSFHSGLTQLNLAAANLAAMHSEQQKREPHS